MGYIGNNFWPDAASYGAGLGQTLGQALIQRPQERYELALQQHQMQQQQVMAGLQMMLAQQRAGETARYHTGMLDVRQQGLQNQDSNEQMRNIIEGLRAQNEAQRPFSLGNGNALIPTPQAQSGGLGTGQPTAQALGNTPTNPQQSAPPGYQLFSTSRQTMPETGNQQFGNALSANNDWLRSLLVTNNIPPQIQQNFSNLATRAMSQLPQQGLGQQQPQQTNQPSFQQGGFDTNAIMQQAQQAIQQGANPQAVHQRLQQQYGLSLQ